MIRALLWDNDGVLVDTEKLYLQACRELLWSVGVELSVQDYAEISLRQGRTVFELARQAGLDDAHVESLRVARNERYAELLAAGVELMGGVHECLDALEGRMPMAIVTSSQPDHFELIHRDLGLLHHFELILTAADFTRFKPHPEPYLLAAERIGADPAECLVIEDTERGLRSALAAGMRCVVVPHALSRHGDFSGATRILDRLDGLPPLVDALGAFPG